MARKDIPRTQTVEEAVEPNAALDSFMRERGEVDRGDAPASTLERFLDPEGDSPESGEGRDAKGTRGGGGSDFPELGEDGGDAPSRVGADGDGSAEEPGSAAEGDDEPPAWLAKHNRRILRRANRQIAELNERIAGLETRLQGDPATGTPAADQEAEPADEPYPRIEEYKGDRAAFDADVERWNNGEKLLGPKGSQAQQAEPQPETAAEPDGERSGDELIQDFAEILDSVSGEDEDLDSEWRQLSRNRELRMTATMLEHFVDGMEEEDVGAAVRELIRSPIKARRIARMAEAKQAAALDRLARSSEDDGQPNSRGRTPSRNRRLPPTSAASSRRDPGRSRSFSEYAHLRRQAEQTGFGGIDSLN